MNAHEFAPPPDLRTPPPLDSVEYRIANVLWREQYPHAKDENLAAYRARLETFIAGCEFLGEDWARAVQVRSDVETLEKQARVVARFIRHSPELLAMFP